MARCYAPPVAHGSPLAGEGNEEGDRTAVRVWMEPFLC